MKDKQNFKKKTARKRTGYIANRLDQLLLDEGRGAAEKLAKELGVEAQSISSYRRGLSDPTVENLIRIADYYNVPTDWLLGRLPESNKSNKPTEREAAEYTGLSSQAIAILHEWSNPGSILNSLYNEYQNYVPLLSEIICMGINANDLVLDLGNGPVKYKEFGLSTFFDILPVLYRIVTFNSNTMRLYKCTNINASYNERYSKSNMEQIGAFEDGEIAISNGELLIPINTDDLLDALWNRLRIAVNSLSNQYAERVYQHDEQETEELSHEKAESE